MAATGARGSAAGEGGKPRRPLRPRIRWTRATSSCSSCTSCRHRRRPGTAGMPPDMPQRDARFDRRGIRRRAREGACADRAHHHVRADRPATTRPLSTLRNSHPNWPRRVIRARWLGFRTEIRAQLVHGRTHRRERAARRRRGGEEPRRRRRRCPTSPRPRSSSFGRRSRSAGSRRRHLGLRPRRGSGRRWRRIRRRRRQFAAFLRWRAAESLAIATSRNGMPRRSRRRGRR